MNYNFWSGFSSSGDKVTFRRNKGMGKRTKYRLEEPES